MSCQSCPTLCDPIDGSPPGCRPWDSPANNIEVGCHFLLQCMKVKSESEVTQSCPILRDPMDCIAYQAPPSMGFPRQRILEWVAISFSRGYSWPRDQTWVSCITGGFFTAKPPGKVVSPKINNNNNKVVKVCFYRLHADNNLWINFKNNLLS